jgi:predicted HD phosphohydrolase
MWSSSTPTNEKITSQITSASSEQVVDGIIRAYKTYASITIEEDIDQLQHAQQCAYLASQVHAEKDLVVAALLHDIGQLPPQVFGLSYALQSDATGILDHEVVGSCILSHLGFNERIQALVGGHVAAKRYLVWKALNDGRCYDLSSASLKTLAHQGGMMSPEEAREFESQDHFQDLLSLRHWDDSAKLVGLHVPAIDSYRDLLRESLSST